MAAAKPELPGQMLALEEHKWGRKRSRSSSGSGDMPQNEAAQKAGFDSLEDAPDTIRPRGYQREMLEASIKQNIIVAVSLCIRLLHIWLKRLLIPQPDGHWQWKDSNVSELYTSLKTLRYDQLNDQAPSNTIGHIYSAILRIRYELERCSNDKV